MALAKNNIIINTDVAAAAHNHSANLITSGTLPLARGGTGQTSIAGLKSALGISGTLGNCRIQSGTINFHDSTTITCSFRPLIIFCDSYSLSNNLRLPWILINGIPQVNLPITDSSKGVTCLNNVKLTWSGNSVTISGGASIWNVSIDVYWVALG